MPGGVRFEGRLGLDELLRALDDLERDIVRDRRLFVGTASMTDRLIGAGVLPRELVERHCAVGPVARGSGVSTDARHERPYGDYRRLGLRVVTRRRPLHPLRRVRARGPLALSLRRPPGDSGALARRADQRRHRVGHRLEVRRAEGVERAVRAAGRVGQRPTLVGVEPEAQPRHVGVAGGAEQRHVIDPVERPAPQPHRVQQTAQTARTAIASPALLC